MYGMLNIKIPENIEKDTELVSVLQFWLIFDKYLYLLLCETFFVLSNKPLFVKNSTP